MAFSPEASTSNGVADESTCVSQEVLDENEDSMYPLNWTIDGDFVQETLSSIGHSTVITEESLTFVVNILHQYCVSRRWQYIIALDGEGYLLPWTLDDEYDDERESRLYAAAQRQANEKQPAPAAGHDVDSFEHSYLQSVRQAMSNGRSKADTNNDKGVVPSSSAAAVPGQAPFIRRSSFSLFSADKLKQFMSDAEGSDSDDDGGDYSSTDDDNAAAPSGGANTATRSGAVHIDIEQKEVKQHHNDDLADAEVPDARTARAQAVARQYAAKLQKNSGHKSRFSVPQTEEQASSALELLHAMVTKVVRNPEPAASAAAADKKKVVRTLSANQMFRQGAPMSGDLCSSPNSGQPALRQVQSSLDLSAPVVDAAAPDLRFSRKRSFRDHRTGGSLSARHTYWSEKEQKSNSSNVPALAQELEMKVVRVQFDKSVLPVVGPAGHCSHREREGDRSWRRHKSSSRHGSELIHHAAAPAASGDIAIGPDVAKNGNRTLTFCSLKRSRN